MTLSCTQLTPLLEAFVAATDVYDSTAFLGCFWSDAVVHDEGQTYRGHPAIRAWFEKVGRKYRFMIEVLAVEVHGDETTLTTRVCGDFKDSPIELRFCLNIAEERIRALSIGG